MRELKIALGNSRQAKIWSNKTMTFEDICERLKVPIRTSETAEEYSKLPKSQRDEIKDKGGFVGGHLRDNRRKITNVDCRSMWTPDLDLATPEFVAALREHISFKCAVYTTHSHTPEAPRLRFVAPFTRDVSADEYVAISRYLAADLGIDMFDECSFIPHQLMYWPTCPSNGEYLCKFFDGELLDPDAILAAHPNWQDCSLLPTTSRESKVSKPSQKPQEDPLTKPGVVGAFCRAYSITAAIDTFLSDVYAPSVTEGRYDYILGESSAGVVLYDDKFAYSHHATDPAYGKLLNAFDLVRIHKFDDEDEKKSFAAMMDFAVKDENVSAMLLQEKQEAAAAEFEDWTKALQRDRGGLLQNSLHNITLIMENDDNLKGICFNQLADGMEIKGEVPWQHPARFWRDADDAQLICYVDANYGTFSARNYQIAVTKVADDRAYHPIREYLASLSPWDRKPRAETILIDYLGAEDNAYTRAVTRKTLCGAVERVRQPGVKFDSIPVLNGPQGIGKSTLISRLGGEWYYEFTGFIRCGQCGANYRAQSKVLKDGTRTRSWHCTAPSGICDKVAIRNQTMKTLVTEVLGLDTFDETTMDREIEYASVQQNTVTFHFRDGHEATLEFHDKRRGKKWTAERREKQSQAIKDSWTEERRAAMSERMKQIRSEKQWPKQ